MIPLLLHILALLLTFTLFITILSLLILIQLSPPHPQQQQQQSPTPTNPTPTLPSDSKEQTMTRKRNRKPNGHRRSNPRRPHQGVLPSIEPPNPTAAPAGQGQLNTTAQPRFGLSSWRETREGARLLDQIGVGHGGGVARERGRPSAEYGADYGADGQEAGGYNVMGRGMGASQNAAGYIVPEGRLKRGIGGGSFVVAGDHTGYNACINAGHGDYSAGYRAQYGSGNDAGYHAKYSRGHVAGYNAKSQLRGNDLSHLIHHDRVSEAAVNAASNLLLPVHPRNRASSAYVPLENDEEFGSGELIEPPCVAALRDTDSVASNTRDTSLNCIFCGGRGHRTGECPDRWGNEGRRAEGIQDQALQTSGVMTRAKRRRLRGIQRQMRSQRTVPKAADLEEIQEDLNPGVCCTSEERSQGEQSVDLDDVLRRIIEDMT